MTNETDTKVIAAIPDIIVTGNEIIAIGIVTVEELIREGKFHSDFSSSLVLFIT